MKKKYLNIRDQETKNGKMVFDSFQKMMVVCKQTLFPQTQWATLFWNKTKSKGQENSFNISFTARISIKILKILQW